MIPQRLVALGLSALVFLSCKAEDPKPSPSGRVKRVVLVKPIETKYMENDDGTTYGLGENLYHRLITTLQNSGRFVVVVDENLGSHTLATMNEGELPDRLRFDFAPIPSAEYQAKVIGLSFEHGSRGMSTWTGFRPDFNTDWNSGGIDGKNEFTPRSLEFARSWLGTTFLPIGPDHDNTISGVDAGDEGEFNLIIAGVRYRRDRFRATAELDTAIKLLAEQNEKRVLISSLGNGFLFAAGASYQEISVDFGVKLNRSRKTVFDLSIEKMSASIADELYALPFRTKVEISGREGIIINAGRREGLIAGDVFTSRDKSGRVSSYTAVEVFQIGSRIEPVGGAPQLSPGDILELSEGKTQTTKAISSSTLAQSSDEPTRRKIIIDPPELLDPSDTEKTAINLKSTIMLPYYLARYFQYDQAVLTKAPERKSLDPLALAANQWNLNSIDLISAWEETKGKGVIVAIIDSGVDYNHKDLYETFERQRVGWDFFSWDERPFDDNSHGTAVAGIIAGQGNEGGSVGIAPEAKLLSYKAINPYGETNSAALYGALKRAIDEGARIVTLAWDSGLQAKALAAMVELAEKHDVLLITAAGDQGRDLREIARYPALYGRSTHLITVAALGKSGGLAKPAGRFSNWGDGYVDIAAPGEAIETLAPRSNRLIRHGSDLAAAHVAGVAALLASKQPALSAAEIKKAILSGASEDKSLNGLITGSKRLSAWGALRIL